LAIFELPRKGGKYSLAVDRARDAWFRFETLTGYSKEKKDLGTLFAACSPGWRQHIKEMSGFKAKLDV
jgi:hypothetical protein